MALAICFVPVLLDFGLVRTIAPTCTWILGFFSQLHRLELTEAAIILIFILIYVALFCGIAWFCYWLSCRAPSEKLRTGIQIAILLGLFSTSFLRVINQEHLQGRTGTYTFWGGCSPIL
jgi:hypothetical protein